MESTHCFVQDAFIIALLAHSLGGGGGASCLWYLTFFWGGLLPLQVLHLHPRPNFVFTP
eukprot:COSAG06_NODE_15200_length_1090_cov_1.920283_2_plen_58_part_01